MTNNAVNAEIDKIDSMLIKLRDEMFFTYKKFKNKELDKFNAISWELTCLKNLVNNK